MRKQIGAGSVLSTVLVSAILLVSPRPAAADIWYPWCGVGESRVFGCFFTSREQCAGSTRWHGGGSCIENYRPRAAGDSLAAAEPAVRAHRKRVARAKLHRDAVDR